MKYAIKTHKKKRNEEFDLRDYLKYFKGKGIVFKEDVELLKLLKINQECISKHVIYEQVRMVLQKNFLDVEQLTEKAYENLFYLMRS